jgi:hypothetical protein
MDNICFIIVVSGNKPETTGPTIIQLAGGLDTGGFFSWVSSSSGSTSFPFASEISALRSSRANNQHSASFDGPIAAEGFNSVVLGRRY